LAVVDYALAFTESKPHVAQMNPGIHHSWAL
jgi:hypothetical protein